MMRMVRATSCCSSRNTDDDALELSERACSVEFRDDVSTSPTCDNTSSTTSASRASSGEQFSIRQRTLSYDRGRPISLHYRHAPVATYLDDVTSHKLTHSRQCCNLCNFIAFSSRNSRFQERTFSQV